MSNCYFCNSPMGLTNYEHFIIEKATKPPRSPRRWETVGVACNPCGELNATRIDPWNAEANTRKHSRDRGCTGKINLGRSYKKQADKLSGKHGKKYGVYSCNYCGGTHLTTKINKACMYTKLLHISEPNA